MTRIEAIKNLNKMYSSLQEKRSEPQTSQERERIAEEMKTLSYCIKTLVSNENKEGQQLTIG